MSPTPDHLILRPVRHELSVIAALLQSIIVVLGVSFVAFALIFLTGDPTEVILGDGADRMTVEEIQTLSATRWDSTAVPGPVRELSPGRRCMAISAIPSSATSRPSRSSPTSCRRRSGWPASPSCCRSSSRSRSASCRRRVRTPLVDRVATVVCAGRSVDPELLAGILLILLFGVELKWLPISGSGSWQSIIMPGITLAAFPIARNMRLTRSSMLDFMQRDFVRTARAKGISGDARRLGPCAAQLAAADRHLDRSRAGIRCWAAR